jgi:hypothetical protein
MTWDSKHVSISNCSKYGNCSRCGISHKLTLCSGASPKFPSRLSDQFLRFAKIDEEEAVLELEVGEFHSVPKTFRLILFLELPERVQ